MNTTNQTPAIEDAYCAQIETTRNAVENFLRTEKNLATFDDYAAATKLAELRGAALDADFTMRQEMKAHKDIARLVRQAEKLQAEFARFQAKLTAVEENIYAKY